VELSLSKIVSFDIKPKLGCCFFVAFITEIEIQFEVAHPGMDITFNFAGSQQLGQGAPGDVFASANPKHMTNVVENGRIFFYPYLLTYHFPPSIENAAR
jgi:hypothetical protein